MELSSLGTVKINEDKLNKKSKGYSELDIVRESPPSFALDRDSEEGGVGGGVGKLCSGKKGRLRSALIGGYWHGEAVNGLTRSGTPYVID